MSTSKPWLMNWVGVSISTQDDADALIPELLKIQAAGRFLSVEPLLGPVDLYKVPRHDDAYFAWRGETGAIGKKNEPDDYVYWQKKLIDWVIIGGESGHGARPCNVEWIRSIVRQCKDAGVPCFVKQLGSVTFDGGGRPRAVPASFARIERLKLTHPKGGDPAEWPEDLRVREFPWGGGR